MPLRDKLAQLLDGRCAQCRATPGPSSPTTTSAASSSAAGRTCRCSPTVRFADIAGAAGPLALAVSVDEEGGRVQRLSSLIGSQPVTPGAGPDQDGRRGVPDRAAARPGHAGAGHHGGLRARRRRHGRARRHRHRRPVVRLGSRRGHAIRRRLRTRTARRGPVAGAQALPGPWPRLRGLPHRRCGDPTAGGSAEQRPHPVPHAGRGGARRGDARPPAGAGTDRQRSGQPESRRVQPAAQRRLRRAAVRRRGVHRRPVVDGGDQ